MSDGSYLLNLSLLIPYKLSVRNTGVIEPTDPGEQSVITFGAGGSQGEVVGSPNTVNSFLLVLPNLGVVQIEELFSLGLGEVPDTSLQVQLLLPAITEGQTDGGRLRRVYLGRGSV